MIYMYTTERNLRMRSGTSTRSTSGVELGKQLAERIIPELKSKGETTLSHDSSTKNLIHQYRKFKETV